MRFYLKKYQNWTKYVSILKNIKTVGSAAIFTIGSIEDHFDLITK